MADHVCDTRRGNQTNSRFFRLRWKKKKKKRRRCQRRVRVQRIDPGGGGGAVQRGGLPQLLLWPTFGSATSAAFALTAAARPARYVGPFCDVVEAGLE